MLIKGLHGSPTQPSLLSLSRELSWQSIANVSFGILFLLVLWPNLSEIYFCAFKCKYNYVGKKHLENSCPLPYNLHIGMPQDQHFFCFLPQLTWYAWTLHNWNELLLPLEFLYDFQHTQLTFIFEAKITMSRIVHWILCQGCLKIFRDYLER